MSSWGFSSWAFSPPFHCVFSYYHCPLRRLRRCVLPPSCVLCVCFSLLTVHLCSFTPALHTARFDFDCVPPSRILCARQTPLAVSLSPNTLLYLFFANFSPLQIPCFPHAQVCPVFLFPVIPGLRPCRRSLLTSFSLPDINCVLFAFPSRLIRDVYVF